MNSVYKINKGINKPIEFKGLKAQYIGYLGAGVIVLLILFAIFYMRQPLKLDFLWAGLCIMGAVYFMFRS